MTQRMYWSELRDELRLRNDVLFMPGMNGYWKKLDRVTMTMSGFRIGQRVKLCSIRGLDQWCGVDRFGTLVKNGPAYQSVMADDTEGWDSIQAKLNQAEWKVFDLLGKSEAGWWRRKFFGAGKKQMWHTGWDATMIGAGMFQITATIAGTMTE